MDTLNKALPEDIVRVTAGFFTMIRPDGPPTDPSMMRDFERARHERDTSGAGAGDSGEGQGPLAGLSDAFDAHDGHEGLERLELEDHEFERTGFDEGAGLERPDRPITETEPDETLGETGKRGDFVRIN